MRSRVPIRRWTLAGAPNATTPAGRSRVTTAPAPTTVSSPIVTPGQTMAPPPSQTLSPRVIGRPYSHTRRRGPGSSGRGAVGGWRQLALHEADRQPPHDECEDAQEREVPEIGRAVEAEGGVAD